MWLPLKIYVNIVSKNQVNNCDINVDDIMKAEDIYGTPPRIIKGNMKHKAPTSQMNITKIPLPAHLLSTIRNIALYIDIFDINGLPFFLKKSGNIYLLSKTALKSRTTSRI